LDLVVLVLHLLAQAKVVMVIIQYLDTLQQLLLLAVVAVADMIPVLVVIKEAEMVDLVAVMVMMVWQLEREILEEMIQDVVLFQREMMGVHLLLIVVAQVVEVLDKQDKEMEMMLAPVEQELQFQLI
tara:strand:+ start:168 stop:548 length:381 start_codon:yes stop_codon:yes gene_type:complete